jgi:hypothetical protein
MAIPVGMFEILRQSSGWNPFRINSLTAGWTFAPRCGIILLEVEEND